MNEKYDVFISHKKEQLSWALRLQATLELYGYRVFVDHATHDKLQAEQDWEEQLRRHCTEATHMVVLWSKQIGVGSFVHQEVQWRIEACHSDPARRITLLPLNELSEAPLSLELKTHYGNRQAFREFIDLYQSITVETARDSSANAIDYFSWHDATRRFIEEAFFNSYSRIVEVPFIVAAMTNEQAKELVQGQNLAVSDAIFQQLMTVAQSTNSFDVARYGKVPEDWQPFPTIRQYDWEASSIGQILARYETERRNYVLQNLAFLNSPEYRLNRVFVPYTSQIAGKAEQRKRAIQRLEKRPCLIFIDPISLMHRGVRHIYDTASRALEYAFTIGMSPFIPVLHQDFSAYLTDESALIDELGLMTPYDRFHSFFNDALKASVMSVDHGYELARWVQFATDNITRYVSERLNDQWNSNPNLRQGPSRPPTL